MSRFAGDVVGWFDWNALHMAPVSIAKPHEQR
jgi:hypothetical protein